MSFSTNDNLPLGQTTYEWNFGDGSPISTNPYHTYKQSGTYTVTVKKSNLEYGSATFSKTVTIYAPGTIQVFVNGPISKDMCTNDWRNITLLSAKVTNGCGSYTFTWEYRSSQNPYFWNLYATGTPVEPPPGFGYTEGTYEIRCVAYGNSCGEQLISEPITLYTYKSDPTCWAFEQQ
jgi:PKD repeat protein